MSEDSVKSKDRLLDAEESSHKKKEQNTNCEKSKPEVEHVISVDEEIEATVAKIAKMKHWIANHEQKFLAWEINFRKEIPQMIEEAFEKRIAAEVEKRVIEIEGESEAYSGKKKKIKKIADIEDEDEKNAVKKAISACIKEEKEKRANEEEIKRKYRQLIRSEVKKALNEEKSDLESSSSNEETLENAKPIEHVLKPHQYKLKIDKSYPRGRSTPKYSPIKDYNNYMRLRYPPYDRL